MVKTTEQNKQQDTEQMKASQVSQYAWSPEYPWLSTAEAKRIEDYVDEQGFTGFERWQKLEQAYKKTLETKKKQKLLKDRKKTEREEFNSSIDTKKTEKTSPNKYQQKISPLADFIRSKSSAKANDIPDDKLINDVVGKFPEKEKDIVDSYMKDEISFDELYKVLDGKEKPSSIKSKTVVDKEMNEALKKSTFWNRFMDNVTDKNRWKESFDRLTVPTKAAVAHTPTMFTNTMKFLHDKNPLNYWVQEIWWKIAWPEFKNRWKGVEEKIWSYIQENGEEMKKELQQEFDIREIAESDDWEDKFAVGGGEFAMQMLAFSMAWQAVNGLWLAKTKVATKLASKYPKTYGFISKLGRWIVEEEIEAITRKWEEATWKELAIWVGVEFWMPLFGKAKKKIGDMLSGRSVEEVASNILQPYKGKVDSLESATKGLQTIIKEQDIANVSTYADLIGKWQKAINEYVGQLNKSLTKLDDLPNVQNTQIGAALNQLKKIYKDTSSSKFQSIKNRVEKLTLKHKSMWLSAKEINDLKILHTEANDLFSETTQRELGGFFKDDLRAVRSDLRQIVEREASKMDIDIWAINRKLWEVYDTQFLLKDQAKSMKSYMGRELPDTIGTKVGKIVSKVPGVKQLIMDPVQGLLRATGTNLKAGKMDPLQVQRRLPEFLNELRKAGQSESTIQTVKNWAEDIISDLWQIATSKQAAEEWWESIVKKYNKEQAEELMDKNIKEKIESNLEMSTKELMDEWTEGGLNITESINNYLDSGLSKIKDFFSS